MDGVERRADLEEVFYTPDIHVRLLSSGKLESQGWGIRLKDGSMELRDRRGDLFAVVSKVNNVYPMELTVIAPGSVIAAWMNDRGSKEPTHQEIDARLNEFAMVATAKGGKGSEVSLLTWHCRLGHLSFKAVVDLSRSGHYGRTCVGSGA